MPTTTWQSNALKEFNAACAKYRNGDTRVRTDPNGRNEESMPRVIQRVEKYGTRCPAIVTVECAHCNAKAIAVDNLVLGILTQSTFAPWATISGVRAVEYDDGMHICNVCVERDEESRAVEYAERYTETGA